MASAEELPSRAPSLSKKDKLKEAGRLKFEAFLKKKAEERSKSAASTGKQQADAVDNKQVLEIEETQQPDSSGVGMLDVAAEAQYQSASFSNNNGNKDQARQKCPEVWKIDCSSLTTTVSVNSSVETKETWVDSVMNGGAQEEYTFSQSNDAKSVKDTVYPNGSIFSRSSNINDFTSVASFYSSDTFVPYSVTNQASGRLSSSYEEPYHQTEQKVYRSMESVNHLTYDTGETNSNSSFDSFNSSHTSPLSTSTSYSSGSSRSPPNQMPAGSVKAGTSSKRSRPSFFDSIYTLKAPSYPYSSVEEAQLDPDVSITSEGASSSIIGSSDSWKPQKLGKIVESIKVFDAAEQSMTNLASDNNSYHDGSQINKELQYCAPKQDDDFSALEQHIEDLTQKKFSLQRGLETSRILGESLAAENASLTEAYNQLGAVINQFKSEMDNLQEEIKTQLAELEVVKREYTNAYMECSAADERAKLLASEVIQLEEKVLKLRSSELKLEQQLDHALSESSSYGKKISRLEREHHELQENIAALIEDKKILQSKIRKSSANGNHFDSSKSTCVKKDSSTSTEDMDGALENSNVDIELAGLLLGDDASSSTQLHRDVEPSLEITSISTPADHMGTIDKIND